MVRRNPQPEATTDKVLECVHQRCSCCGRLMHNDYENYRTVRTLKGVVRLHLKVRRCPNEGCKRYHLPYRPEAEGKWALLHQEFGFDVIAEVGELRYQQKRSVPQIHSDLVAQGMEISERSVSHLLAHYC